jgi:ubiquinone/menaquinone biosynthesis C-methylase UbiE
MTDPWDDRAFLRGTQYKTDANLAARQSIYAYGHPRIDLAARALDLAAPAPSDIIVDVGCGNGTYLAELSKRGCAGHVLGVDLSFGMLAAARDRLSGLSMAADAVATGPDDSPASPDDATGSPPSAVALASADATALPLRDGVADLALAMHMLYHVPDPADALRELRRVTCPGGRVVIVLNGADHLRELRAAVAAARGADPSAMRERVRLEDGESLARSFFPQVTRHDFVAELRVPSWEPIADYVRSLSGTSHGVDQERVAETVAADFPRTAAGHYVITTHCGCLVCENG